MHHQRAEVRDIRHRVGGLLVGDALVGAQPRVLLGELLRRARRRTGESTSAALDVDAELDRAGAHLERLAEDREVGDAALEHRRRRAEHAVVVALGQHDAAAVGARALDQLVLEHERRDDGRAREPEQRG